MDINHKIDVRNWFLFRIVDTVYVSSMRRRLILYGVSLITWITKEHLEYDSVY